MSFPRPSLSPGLLTLLALFVGVSLVAEPTAAQPLTITAGLKFSPPTYRTHSWQPVHLEFVNDASFAIDGSAVVTLTHPQAPAAMVLPATVPPHARVRATMWAYFPPPSTPAETRKGNIPPLGMAEFRGREGALLARADIAGLPISGLAGEAASDEDERGELILVVGRREEIYDEPYEATWPIRHLADETGIPMAVANVELDRLPHESAGLRSLRAIVLEGLDPQSLDRGQCAALLEYLRGGGTVVVSAPIDAVARAGGWFEPHFPVRLIGSRMADAVEVSADAGGGALRFREFLPIVEAVEQPGATVLLRSRDYVHVATKPVGLGKVVFTSFPINALNEKQPQVAALWEQLLDVRQPLWDWDATRLGQARHQVLGSMIGRKVAPWSVAAGVAAGYVLLVLAAQALFVGPSRPKAFAVSVALAVVVSGALLAMGMSRRVESELQMARLAVVDVGPQGNGWQQESVALVGKDQPHLAMRARDERVMLRPALADEGNRPTVRQQPFAIDDTGVYAERIERVWEAAGPADPQWRIDAVASFGPGGLSLNVNNGMGMPLRAPLVVWNGRAASMEDLPPGAAAVNELSINERGNFSSAAMLTSDEAKRRALIVRSLLLPPAGQLAPSASAAAADAPPMMLAWLPAEVGQELVQTSDQETIERKSMVLVRTPLRVEPTATGRIVRVPAAFVRTDTGRLPYDREKGESVSTPQPGQWQISFAAPPQIGRVRPTRLILSARVALPAHSLSIRTRRLPAPLATWSRVVGPKEVAFDCAPGDYDEHGRVNLTLEVQPLDVGSSVEWQISDLGAGIEAEVVGPPAPIVLEPPQGADASRERVAADEESKDQDTTGQ